MFFQNKSDSISIYVNGKKVAENYLIHNSDLVSTDYTGFDFSKEYLEKKNIITIVYQKVGSYIEFKLDKKFPLTVYIFMTLENSMPRDENASSP